MSNDKTEAAPTPRYPAGINVSLADFEGCGWKQALGQMPREGYSAMWQALSKAAKEAIAAGQFAQGKVLWLLADACSMMLKPASVNEPFQPILVMSSRRSALPEDLEPETLALFAEAAEHSDDIWLRARLADLVWLQGKPRDVKFALMAIDAYRQVPIDSETWIRDGRECLERAARLSIMLRAGAGNRLKEIGGQLLDAFATADEKAGYLALWVSDLCDELRLARPQAADIANKLQALANVFEKSGDLHRARDYFEAAAKWHKRSGDEAAAAAAAKALAECWVKEAAARISGPNPSHMAAASFFEKAIHAYRDIPAVHRALHRVDERLSEIHRMMSESGEKMLGEMGVIESPPIDISKLVEAARNAVSGKSLLDALVAFAGVYGGTNYKELRESAARIGQQNPLQALMPATIMSRDGRVIAKRPGASGDEEGVALWADTLRHFAIQVGLVVQGDIYPALEQLLLEHRIRETDLTALAKRSSVVPPKRWQLVGKALFAGFERDFASAVHLLVPQVEHMVRWHLKRQGVKTTAIDQDGIENEVGLSALLEKPEVEKIFGENLAFELKAVFADPFGANLRNEVAHGLLDDDEVETVNAIFAWWWFFRLVVKTLPRRQPAG